MKINLNKGEEYGSSFICSDRNDNCSNHTKRYFQRGAKSSDYRSNTKEDVRSVSREEGALYGDLLLVFNCYR